MFQKSVSLTIVKNQICKSNQYVCNLAECSFNLCPTESCMHRAGFTETRSHPPLQILLKPTTKNAGRPPAWCITACYRQLFVFYLSFRVKVFPMFCNGKSFCPITISVIFIVISIFIILSLFPSSYSA